MWEQIVGKNRAKFADNAVDAGNCRQFTVNEIYWQFVLSKFCLYICHQFADIVEYIRFYINFGVFLSNQN